MADLAEVCIHFFAIVIILIVSIAVPLSFTQAFLLLIGYGLLVAFINVVRHWVKVENEMDGDRTRRSDFESL